MRWLDRFLAKFRDRGEAHIRVGREWMTLGEYRKRFGVPAPIPGRRKAVQLELFPNVPGTGNTIDERFADFHAKNPHVYRNLVMLAFEDEGKPKDKKRSISALIEDLRYEYEDRTEFDPKDYKINNNFASRYSRLIMANEPRLAGQFEVRRLKSL